MSYMFIIQNLEISKMFFKIDHSLSHNAEIACYYFGIFPSSIFSM